MGTPQNTIPVENPVKRTFWFGMLFALAEVPYIISVVLTLMMIATPNYSDYILPIVDARIYGLLAGMNFGGYLVIIITAIPVLSWAVLLWVAWKMGFIDMERLNFWRYAREYKKKHPVRDWKMIARAIALVVVVICGFVLKSYGLYLIGMDVFVPAFSYYRGALGPAIFIAVYSIPALPIVFMTSTFGYAIITSQSMYEFKLKSKVALAGLLCFVTSLSAIYIMQNQLDIGKKFEDIPGIGFDTEPAKLFILSGDVYTVNLQEIHNDIDINPFSNSMVPYSNSNETAIRSYLVSKDHHSALRGQSYNYMIYNRLRQLDIDGVRALRLEAFNITGDVIHAMLGLNSINAGSATENNLKALEGFCDESKFSVMGKSALWVSRGYVKFGKLEKANYWYEKGCNSGEKVTEVDKENYKPPMEPPFYKCRVSGRINLDGVFKQGIRVGIIRSDKAESIANEMPKDEESAYQFIWMSRVAGGTATGPDGRFSFTGLGENDYVLLLSLEDVPGKKYRVINSPGSITVSEEHPSIDVGTIELVLEDEDNG